MVLVVEGRPPSCFQSGSAAKPRRAPWGSAGGGGAAALRTGGFLQLRASIGVQFGYIQYYNMSIYMYICTYVCVFIYLILIYRYVGWILHPCCTWTPKVCRMVAFWAVSGGVGGSVLRTFGSPCKAQDNGDPRNRNSVGSLFSCGLMGLYLQGCYATRFL